MDTAKQTIKQRIVEIEVDDKTIKVRRMKWKAAKNFADQIAGFLASMGTGTDALVNALKDLPGLIKKSDELITGLVVACSDLNAEGFQELDIVQALKVLETAVELNFGDELKNSFGAIGDRLTALAPAKVTKSMAEFTPTSPKPGSLPSTSTTAPSTTSTSS